MNNVGLRVVDYF